MDITVEPAGTVWQQLRGTRWSPGGRATTGSRRKTYVTALEQAEQMFRAAEVVGPATRPLQVFYGLSQAGRAITAAAVKLKGEQWRLISHGIHASGFDDGFPEIALRTDPPGAAGSFVRLSELLDSPLWEQHPLRLEDLWDQLPVTLAQPLTDRDRFPPLFADHRCIPDEAHPLLTVPVCDIPDRVIAAGTRRAWIDFADRYPGLRGHHSHVVVHHGADAPPRFTSYPHGGGELIVNWSMPGGSAPGSQRVEYLRTLARPYVGSCFFLPVIDLMHGEMHPLMAWWAVLYGLSMLARYQPAQWADLINVDSSQHAVAIEGVLGQALEHLPELILETIRGVSHWDRRG